MKRSEINGLIRDASAKFQQTGWALPPEPRWDVTDFGLGDWRRFGLVLVNLAEEPEYCEKLMYAKAGMVTPAHCHQRKKEDIVCRNGRLRVQVWRENADEDLVLKVSGKPTRLRQRTDLFLEAGERITLLPGVYHEFEPVSAECVMGEISTANDDAHDNFFVNPGVGRFPEILEDEAPLVRLVSELG